jgi:hypothetical protein
MSGQPQGASAGDGYARAGFVCGLVSFSAALIAGLLASGVVPGGTSGEGMLLLIAATLVALVGLLASAAGLRSRSRRQMAIAGMILALIPMAFLALALLVIYLSWSRCAPSCI